MSTDPPPVGLLTAAAPGSAAVPPSPAAQLAGGPPAGGSGGFDLDRAWRVHPQVAIRPERFGALLYHFGTRRLSFLKSPALLTVVSSLAGQPSAREACRAAGVGPADLPAYASALATLAGSQMICLRSAS